MTPYRLHYAWIVLCALAAPVLAQDAGTSTGSTAKTIVDVIDIVPWGFEGSDGKPSGIFPAFFKRLSERSGCVLETRLTPIARAVLEVTKGTADITMMLDRADLNERAVVVGDVAAMHLELWLPPGSNVRSLDDLAGKNVGVLRGPTYHEGFNQDTRIVKLPVTTPRQQLEMLVKGRLDGAIGVRESFFFAASKLGISPSVFAPPIDLGRRIMKMWMTPSMGGSLCAKQLAKTLAEMRSSGEVDRLIFQTADR